MNKNIFFFVQLTLLSFLIYAVGFGLHQYQQVLIPTMFFSMVGFYFAIATLAFFINVKGTQQEADLAVWYYLGSIMGKFLLAAASVFVLIKIFPDQKHSIVYTSFVLYPLYEAVVIFDIYKRVRK